MSVTTTNGWIAQPNVCRCCLATNGVWDLTCAYISQAGDKENYSDMLHDCFGVSLSNLSGCGRSRLVCSSCVEHLRDANSFKKQVLKAEETLVGIWSRTETAEEVKFEEETNDDNLSISCEDIKTPEGIDNIEASNVRKRRKIHVKLERERITEEYDSDTPIAELSRKYASSVNVNKNHNEDNQLSHDIELKDDEITLETANRGQKPVSERKRVIVTCNTVLKDSTACPFRHHKSWFRCFYCPQDFMAIDTLRNHTINTHHNVTDELKKIKRYPRSLQIEISNLECRECQLSLTDVENMCRHFVDIHGKLVYKECIADYKVNISPFSCHLCERQFHVFRTLTTHLNEHYANFICDVCGKSFIHSKRLKVHKRTHEHGQYPCTLCGKVLKTKTSKANHMETHSKRVIKCQICFKPMKHYNHRVKHMSEVHNITYKFKCPICPREYNIKHYLATHIRQTHGHKNKKCIECGMAFITNHGLKKHMLKHSGVKPYSCRVCCKTYARSYSLKEHMRGHDTPGTV